MRQEPAETMMEVAMRARMRRRCLHGVSAGLVLIVCGSAVGLTQAKDPANGVWKLNLTKSKYSPGPAPKELTVTIEPAGPGRKVTVSGVAGDGTALNWGYSGTFDGKDIRVTGANPDADMVVLRRISPNSTRTTFKKAGKRTIVSGVSVSEDGKTLAVASSGVNAKGETVTNLQVFDKQ
jgi:hypothetical protein